MFKRALAAVAIGDARLTVHPSYAAFQAATGDSDRTGSRA